MAIATAADWGNAGSIAIATALAFFFGYLLTLYPLLRAALPLRQATGIALGFVIAFAPAWYVNRLLIARGRGHALAHTYHGH